MTKHFNRSDYKESRKFLRNHQTYTEYLLWKQLKSKRLCGYKFRRQYSVDQYIVDFYCPKVKLAIEVDGISHDPDEQKRYDNYRQRYIEKLGLKFIRVTDEEILLDLDRVLIRIKKKIEELETSRSLDL
jgi:very-short-patch-repair endonuclease